MKVNESFSFCLIFKLYENESKIELIINLAGSNKSILRTIFRNTDLTREQITTLFRITLPSNAFSESQRLVETILKVSHSSESFPSFDEKHVCLRLHSNPLIE